MKLLEVVGLKKYYGKKNGNITKACNGIDFSLDEQDFVSIMGPSGSGKTTLLNCIASFDKVTSGAIYFNGTDITDFNDNESAKFRSDNLGFVFQEYNLLDSLTLKENIILPMTLKGYKTSEIKLKLDEYASKFDLVDLLDKYPSEVSGGERQKTAVCRAILASPKLILADEPTGALDSKSSRVLLETLEQFNSLGSTILMVTHDAFSASFCKRVIFVKDGRCFSEIRRGDKTRREFFDEILDTLTLLGGDLNDLL